MTSPVDEVLERLRLNTAVREQAARDEVALVLAAVDAGAQQKDIAAAIGRTREHVRLLVRRERADA